MSDSWKTTTIRQCLVESFAGEWGTDPKPGNAKVLRATDIDDDGHVVGSGVFRQLPIGKLTSKRLLDGDILLEGSGGGPGKPVGRVAYFEARNHYEAAVCSNFFKTLRPKSSEIEPRFLLRKLAWFYKQPALLILQQQTTGIINLKFEGYLSARIEIPESIGEQQKLAQVLDTLDKAIFETDASIAKLKAIKQGLLHDLLTRGIGTNDELRPPQTEAPHIYKESPLGWIPKEWVVVTLESVSKTVTSGSRDWARFYADSGALFVRIGNLTRQHINFRYESTIYVRPPRNADGQRTRLESGDILISITADLGIVGVVPDGLGEAYINQHIALVRPNFDAVNSRFVGHYLGGPIAQTYIRRLNDAGAKAGLNLPTIRGLLAVVPSRTEQDRIAARLDEIDKRIQSTTAESAKLAELKLGLMDDLLTGRVRVTGLNAAASINTDDFLTQLCFGLYQAEKDAVEELKREYFGDQFLPELIVLREDKVRIEIRKENVSHNAPHLHITHSDKIDVSLSLIDLSILAGKIDSKTLKHFRKKLLPKQAELQAIWNELNEKDDSTGAEVLISNMQF